MKRIIRCYVIHSLLLFSFTIALFCFQLIPMYELKGFNAQFAWHYCKFHNVIGIPDRCLGLYWIADGVLKWVPFFLTYIFFMLGNHVYKFKGFQQHHGAYYHEFSIWFIDSNFRIMCRIHGKYLRDDFLYTMCKIYVYNLN